MCFLLLMISDTFSLRAAFNDGDFHFMTEIDCKYTEILCLQIVFVEEVSDALYFHA